MDESLIEVELREELNTWQGIWHKGRKGFLSLDTGFYIQFEVFGNCFPIRREQFDILDTEAFCRRFGHDIEPEGHEGVRCKTCGAESECPENDNRKHRYSKDNLVIECSDCGEQWSLR